jgi:alkanesulfonate monooxygenase SsuD/methylene tetrahydromethanopterin reductase-like flavin-dependent oxidoreductase (luciferase family)
MPASAPRVFAPGSISLGVHPVSSALGAPQQVDHLIAQAVAAELAGFDGVTVSEHHAGFPGYLPQPLLATNWLLGATRHTWGAPAPTLLGLRSAQLLAEELAWTMARFPGRVGAVFAPGYARSDFEAVRQRFDDRLIRFPYQLQELMEAWSASGPLAADPAVATCSAPPMPFMVAANSEVSVRRAAFLGLGVLFPGGEEASRLRRLGATYAAEGGAQMVVAIATAWIGAAPDGADDADDVFRAAAAPGMRQSTGFRQGPHTGTADEVAASVAAFAAESGVSALNLRVHRHGAAPDDVIEQIRRLGAEVLPVLRREFRGVR